MPKPPKPVKLIQLLCTPWTGSDNRLTYTLWALGDDGVCYRHSAREGGGFFQPVKLSQYAVDEEL